MTKSPPPVNHKLLKRRREKGTGKLHAGGKLHVNSRVDIRIHIYISIRFQHRIMRNILKRKEVNPGYYFIQGGTKAKTIRRKTVGWTTEFRYKNQSVFNNRLRVIYRIK